MRLMAALIALALPGLALGNEPGPAPMPAEDRPSCESHAPRWDRRDIRCPMSASGIVRHFRFTARFSGSHDDTTASLRPTIDGAPLACDTGSKTELMGEDGDVSLECRFSVSAGPTQVLRVMLSWHHAEYTDFEFESE